MPEMIFDKVDRLASVRAAVPVSEIHRYDNSALYAAYPPILARFDAGAKLPLHKHVATS